MERWIIPVSPKVRCNWLMSLLVLCSKALLCNPFQRVPARFGLVSGLDGFQVWDIFHTCARLVALANLHPLPRLLREVRLDLQRARDSVGKSAICTFATKDSYTRARTGLQGACSRCGTFSTSADTCRDIFLQVGSRVLPLLGLRSPET